MKYFLFPLLGLIAFLVSPLGAATRRRLSRLATHDEIGISGNGFVLVPRGSMLMGSNFLRIVPLPGRPV